MIFISLEILAGKFVHSLQSFPLIVDEQRIEYYAFALPATTISSYMGTSFGSGLLLGNFFFTGLV